MKNQLIYYGKMTLYEILIQTAYVIFECLNIPASLLQFFHFRFFDLRIRNSVHLMS
jgi:hypothetical protein